MSSAEKKPGRRLRWVGYVLLALVLLCALNEAALRLALHFKNTRAFDRYLRELPKLTKGQTVTFGLMVQPSLHSKLIYEMRPHMDVMHKDVNVRTNKEGWRDRDYPVKRPAGKSSVRILGVGDSNMFGWGVRQGGDYLTALEQTLNKRYPQKKWEVINSGTPGYNTFMKVENLRTRALKYKPDIVILQHTINDLLLPEFLYEYPDPLSTRRSYFWDLIMSKYKMKETKLKVVFEADFKEVPEEFKYMEGEEGFARAFVNLKRMRKEHGFEVVILVSHDHPMGIANAILQLSKELGFHAMVKLHRTDDPKLIVSKVDLHPSELGHKLISEAVLEFMLKRGLLKDHIK